MMMSIFVFLLSTLRRTCCLAAGFTSISFRHSIIPLLIILHQESVQEYRYCHAFGQFLGKSAPQGYRFHDHHASHAAPCTLRYVLQKRYSGQHDGHQAFGIFRRTYKSPYDSPAANQTIPANVAQCNTPDVDGKLLNLEGYVITKRSLGRSLSFLDILLASKRAAENYVDDTGMPSAAGKSATVLQQVLLKRQEYSHDDLLYFDGYQQALIPGMRVAIDGVITASSTSSPASLNVRTIRIRSLPRNPQHVARILHIMALGKIPIAELAGAFHMSTRQLEEAISTLSWKSETKQSVQVSNSSTLIPIHHGTPVSPSNVHNKYTGLAKSILSSIPQPVDYPTQLIFTANQRAPSTGAKVGTSERFHPPLELVQHVALRNNSSLAADLKTADHATHQDLCAPYAAAMTNETTKISPLTSLVGWVQNRQRFAYSVARFTLSFVPPTSTISPSSSTEEYPQAQRVTCILHPSILSGVTGVRMSSTANGYNGNNRTSSMMDVCMRIGSLLAPASQVRFQGYYCSSDTENAKDMVFWVTDIQLLRASWRPSIVQYLMELVYNGTMEASEAGRAVMYPSLDEILDMHELTERQWKATEISATLQSERSRMTSIPPASIEILSAWINLRQQYPVQMVPLIETDGTEGLGGGNYSRAGSRWKLKKEPQLEWMTQQIKDIVESRQCYGQRPIQILDIGGGKGFLANQLAHVFGPAVHVRVIDVAPKAIKNGMMKSKRLQLPVQYTVGDASRLDIPTMGDAVDVVVGLHACGALTDVALGQALLHNASFVICSCCFRSNPWLRVPLPSQNMRQTSVSPQDWLGVDPTEYSTLTLLAEVQGDVTLANHAMHTISALRASAVRNSSQGRMKVSIRSFPLEFSSRNFCLVGHYEHSA